MKSKKPAESKASTPQLEVVLLAALVSHPDQGRFFRKYGEFEYQKLMSDIGANGLRDPIEVLPPGNAAGLKPYTISAGTPGGRSSRNSGAPRSRYASGTT
jgi:hypothetical protein